MIISLYSLQFQYGEDSLSVLKTNLLNSKQFPFLIANQKTAAGRREVSRLREILDRKKAKRWDKSVCYAMSSYDDKC